MIDEQILRIVLVDNIGASYGNRPGKCECEKRESLQLRRMLGEAESTRSAAGDLWHAAVHRLVATCSCADGNHTGRSTGAVDGGNKRYTSANSNSRSKDFAARRKATVDGQHPFATVLSCADSRVSVELILDAGIGQISTCRVAANICTPETVTSIEFGVEESGTPLVMVLGHQNSGAVTAATRGKSAPGGIDVLFLPTRAALEKAGSHVNAAVKANALIRAILLRGGSPVLAEAEEQRKAKVVAAHYHLADGTVTPLG